MKWGPIGKTLVDAARKQKGRFAIITDDNVRDLYGEEIKHLLLKEGYEVHLLSFPEGESFKTRKTKESLEDQLFELKCGRDTTLIALGGGIVTDLAGFIAATFNRGVSLINIPTTLVAMVDASLGGKTGVNVPYGKNLIGAFYPAHEILIDSSFLETLPLKEFKNGIVEMIKHGLIASEPYFAFLEEHADDILSRVQEPLEQAILESVQIKQKIVQEDPFEKGKRRVLNLGHTVGHALEVLSHHRLSHGEAVALGILAECKWALDLGFFNPLELYRIESCFKKYGILVRSSYDNASLESMLYDKKAEKGVPRFVALEKIGVPLAFDGEYCTFSLDYYRPS